MVAIILNLTLALMVLEECAGMMIECPVSRILDLSSITISAFPSITWIKVSKGDVFFVRASPESNETAVTLPVLFLIIVLMTTALGIYSTISTIMKAFAFSSSGFSNGCVP